MKAVLIPLLLASLLVGSACAVELGLPSAAVPGGLGVNISSPEAEFDMIQASGVRFVRMNLYSQIIETTLGHYNFSEYNAMSAACAARGIRIVYDLYCGNPVYGNTDMGSAQWRQYYTNFAAAAAANFKGQGNLYELWNEPNGQADGSQIVANYMAFVEQVAPAMRTADPTAPILGPAINLNNTSSDGVSGTDWLTGCVQQGLLNCVDAVSIHPYANPPDAKPEQVVGLYTTVRNLMQTYGGKTLPIVSGEWGYSTSIPISAQTQGDYLARSCLVNLSQGIPLSIWFEWKDEGTDAGNWQDNYGVVTASLVPKPAYNEMKLLTSSLKGETFYQRLSDRYTSDWLMVFKSPSGQQTLAAWTTGNPRTVTVSGWGTLQLTSTPFYVNPTLLPGDANLDGTVDVKDLAILAANYRKHVTGGWMQADFNNDGVVDVEDLGLLAANYRHSLASDVVPAYDGLDAAAIGALSLAGVTVVPELAPLALLASGGLLLGVLALSGWQTTGLLANGAGMLGWVDAATSYSAVRHSDREFHPFTKGAIS